MTVALIDGDILIYRIAAAGETEIDWGDDLWTLHSDAAEMKELVDRQIADIMDATKADDVRPALSGSGNFRYDLYPAYKGNRKGTRKPLALKELRRYLIEEWGGFLKEEMEADDVLGIWQTRAKPKSTVIVTADKDLRTIPGLHYNPYKPREGVVEVSEEEANHFHMIQTLTGDATDNIPGCPGYGPKTAEKVLPEPEHLVDMWEKVVDCYIKKKLSPDDALLNARLTRILQASDFDFEVGELILWEPPQ